MGVPLPCIMQAVQCQDEFCNFATFAKKINFIEIHLTFLLFSTTPQHIKAIAEAVKDIKPRQRKADLNPNEMLLSGLGMVLNKMPIKTMLGHEYFCRNFIKTDLVFLI